MSEAPLHYDLGGGLEGHTLLLWMTKPGLWLRRDWRPLKTGSDFGYATTLRPARMLWSLGGMQPTFYASTLFRHLV